MLLNDAPDRVYNLVMVHTHMLGALAVFLLLAGCSGSTSNETSAGAGGGGGIDGGGGADGGCVTAVEGVGCIASQTPCMPAGDPCCIGYMWSCDPTSGTWRKMGLGCACIQDGGAKESSMEAATDATDEAITADAPADTSYMEAGEAGGPFACGTTTCTADQICTARPPGIPVEVSPPPLYYSCMQLPPACQATPTCVCVEANINTGMCSVTDCSVDAEGHIMVDCMGM